MFLPFRTPTHGDRDTAVSAVGEARSTQDTTVTTPTALTLASASTSTLPSAPPQVLPPNGPKQQAVYWFNSYQEVKIELSATKEELKALRAAYELRLDSLVTLIRDESKSRQAADVELRALGEHVRDRQVPHGDATLVDKLLDAERANRKYETEVETLNKHIQTLSKQVTRLAGETHEWRKFKIDNMFPLAEPFQDPQLVLCPFACKDVQAVMKMTAETLSNIHQYFVPRPPRCMPLRVASPVQHGYFFNPTWGHPPSLTFELVVELSPDRWTYLGTYVSGLLVGYEMKLSEWCALDEDTRVNYIAQVTSEMTTKMQRQGTVPHTPAEIRCLFDTGEWTVPCFSLQCVGFNMAFYDATHAAANSLASEKDAVADHL